MVLIYIAPLSKVLNRTNRTVRWKHQYKRTEPKRTTQNRAALYSNEQQRTARWKQGVRLSTLLVLIAQRLEGIIPPSGLLHSQGSC